jgi:hypothetical protein
LATAMHARPRRRGRHSTSEPAYAGTTPTSPLLSAAR